MHITVTALLPKNALLQTPPKTEKPRFPFGALCEAAEEKEKHSSKSPEKY